MKIDTKPITLDVEKALAVVWLELDAVTVDNWTDEDYADEPLYRALADDITARRLTVGVLDEVEQCLGRDWCRGAIRSAFEVVLAAQDRMERFDPATTYSRRPRTRVINGTRYIVG